MSTPDPHSTRRHSCGGPCTAPQLCGLVCSHGKFGACRPASGHGRQLGSWADLGAVRMLLIAQGLGGQGAAEPDLQILDAPVEPAPLLAVHLQHR